MGDDAPMLMSTSRLMFVKDLLENHCLWIYDTKLGRGSTLQYDLIDLAIGQIQSMLPTSEACMQGDLCMEGR